MTSEAREKRARTRYPTKAKIIAAVQTARELGLEVAGFEVFPDGGIKVFEGQPVALRPRQAFDRYEGEL